MLFQEEEHLVAQLTNYLRIPLIVRLFLYSIKRNKINRSFLEFGSAHFTLLNTCNMFIISNI